MKTTFGLLLAVLLTTACAAGVRHTQVTETKEGLFIKHPTEDFMQGFWVGYRAGTVETEALCEEGKAALERRWKAVCR